MTITRTIAAGWLALSTLLTGCGASVAPEVHLIPAHYEGPLIVLYGRAGYPPLPRSGDSLVYDFRPGGVLRTSTPLRAGSGPADSFQYYYVDAAGQRTRIRKVEDYPALHQVPATEPCVVVSAGRVSENMVSEFLTSAQRFARNESRADSLTDRLTTRDTVSAPIK